MNLPQRRRLRLGLRDFAAGAAFSAVALSGAIPSFVSALFGVSFGLSLWGKRPFSNQRAWSALALLATAVLLFGLAFRGVLDLVVAAVSFATLVTAHRMLSEPTPTTDQQVLLASLLLISGAAALSGDVWYALCLLAFGVFACLSLGLTAIEGPVEREEELPVAPVLKQVSVGVGLALMGGIAFFILFPRLSWNVAARRTGPGLFGGTTGMTDRVRLSGGGNIKTSARVVLRATLEPMPLGERLDRYWVGRHFDAFDGKEWRGTGEPLASRSRVMLGQTDRAQVQRIELLPAYDSRTLVGLEHPVSFGPATGLGMTGNSNVLLIQVGNEEVRFADSPSANAYTYVAHSRTDVPMLEEDESLLDDLRSLPHNLDARVAQLTSQIVGREVAPERLATLLENWLKSNLEYTLELPGDVEDPLADFLFVRKMGHCEHFATALAVMLRTRGVATRVVGGFFGGEKVGDHFVVRAGDAHAWVEAYSPKSGWLRFDATPENGRGSRAQALFARLTDAYERLEELWRSRVIDYSIITQWNFVRQLIRPPVGAAGDDEPANKAVNRANLPSLRVMLGVLGLTLLGWLLFRLLTKPIARRHPAASFLLELERRLASQHIAFKPEEDIEALSRRLTAERHRLADPLSHATLRYLEARFGQRPMSAEERRALLSSLDKRRTPSA